MNEVRLFDPFALDPIEDTFRSLMRPWRIESAAEPVPRIRLDVSELNGNFSVKAEIPGVRKEDIDVRIDGNMVTISAEVKKAQDEKKDSRTLRSERLYGYASRTFSLSCPVDETRADARYESGILELTLPKKGAAASKRLSVH